MTIALEPSYHLYHLSIVYGLVYGTHAWLEEHYGP